MRGCCFSFTGPAPPTSEPAEGHMYKLGALTAFALVACGALQGDTGASDPLVTMTGLLSGDDQLLTGTRPRVAVVWMQDDGAVNVAEDLPVQPVFPSRFVLPLRRPPPRG